MRKMTATILSCALLATGTALYAQGIGSNNTYEYTYYSNASKNVQVGYVAYNCEGGTDYSSGYQTQYYTKMLYKHCPSGVIY